VHPNTHTYTGRGTKVGHTLKTPFTRTQLRLKSVFKNSKWLTDINSTCVNPLKLFGMFYCSMFAPCRCVWAAVLCVYVSSIKLEKLVGRGEALLLQTHSTHTRMMEGGLLSFLFFSSPFPFWTDTHSKTATHSSVITWSRR